MPTTRSAAKQTQLDENSEDRKSGSAARKASATDKISKSKKAASGSGSNTKRQATEKPNATRATDAETAHQPPSDLDTTSESEKPIIINRAPVLQLWSACVAQFLHPELRWDTCLSIGGAVSSLCAISKGRAIGMIEPKEADGDHQSKKQQNLERVEVMGFSLHIKDGNALISGRPKPVKEDSLRTKFGSEEYNASLVAFQKALSTWKGKEEELDKKAFHMYERFRPNVSGGQKGWGRKGEFDLKEVANIIAK